MKFLFTFAIATMCFLSTAKASLSETREAIEEKFGQPIKEGVRDGTACPKCIYAVCRTDAGWENYFVVKNKLQKAKAAKKKTTSTKLARGIENAFSVEIVYINNISAHENWMPLNKEKAKGVLSLYAKRISSKYLHTHEKWKKLSAENEVNYLENFNSAMNRKFSCDEYKGINVYVSTKSNRCMLRGEGLVCFIAKDYAQRIQKEVEKEETLTQKRLEEIGEKAKTAKLALLSWQWRTEHGFAICEGVVANITDQKLSNIQAVCVFLTRDNEIVKSGTALLKFNPLMPNQSSPFKVMATNNPLIEKAVISFGKLMGEKINYLTKEEIELIKKAKEEKENAAP